MAALDSGPLAALPTSCRSSLKGFGEIDGFALKANPAVASDLSDPVVAFVIRGFRFSIRRFSAEFVNVVRSFHLESFVRTLCIVFSSKPVEAFLLLQKVTTGGPSGLFFEGEMQSFESSVLLWMAASDSCPFTALPTSCRSAGLDFLVGNAERFPPSAQGGEAQKSAGSKWRAIVGEDDFGHTVALKSIDKSAAGTVSTSVFECRTSEEEATVVVADGQREAVIAVLQPGAP